MIGYIFKEMKRNKLLKLISILQLSFTIMLTLFMVSSITSRYTYYKPLKDSFSNKGFMVMSGTFMDENNEIYTDSEQLRKELTGVKSIKASYFTFGNFQSGDMTQINGYPDDIFSKFSGNLESGKWYSDDSSDIHAVIGTNSYGVKKGDKIVVNTDYGEQIINITGVLAEGGKVFGNQGEHLSLDNCTFEDMYIKKYHNAYLQEYESTDDEEIKLMLEELMQQEIPEEALNTPELYMSCTELNKISNNPFMGGNIIIEFDENISPEQISENYSKLLEFDCIVNLLDLTTLNQNSVDYINSQLYTILPMIICIFILSIITSGTICIISGKKMLDTYSVFFLCGSNWKGLVKINLGSNLILVCFAIMLSAAAMIVMHESGAFAKMVIQFGSIQIGFCFALVLFFLFISVIIPYVMMKNHTPKEIITHKQ